ncbi:MAG: hypothetical protein H0W90_04910 [Actinobacteria bacterium]|nr:hypothetical protein [Actinomycetota bacterium]
MSLIKKFRPSPAMVIGCLALLLALGGTGYAASQALPRNSVTSIQVKDRSLLARDFKAGQIPRGPAGPAGAAGSAGPQGPAGPAGSSGSSNVKWALVRPDGGIAAQSGGITLSSHATGTYVLNFGSTVTGKPIIASGGFAGDGASATRGETVAGPCGAGAEGVTCATTNTNQGVQVETHNQAGALADHSFYVAVIG